jgi:hypothetical protein
MDRTSLVKEVEEKEERMTYQSMNNGGNVTKRPWGECLVWHGSNAIETLIDYDQSDT